MIVCMFGFVGGGGGYMIFCFCWEVFMFDKNEGLNLCYNYVYLLYKVL